MHVVLQTVLHQDIRMMFHGIQYWAEGRHVLRFKLYGKESSCHSTNNLLTVDLELVSYLGSSSILQLEHKEAHNRKRHSFLLEDIWKHFCHNVRVKWAPIESKKRTCLGTHCSCSNYAYFSELRLNRCSFNFSMYYRYYNPMEVPLFKYPLSSLIFWYYKTAMLVSQNILQITVHWSTCTQYTYENVLGWL